MAASTRALLFIAVAAAAVLGTAHGASYTVGAPAGSWDLRTNYTAWASSITFRARDQLVFRYSRALHNVLEVSKADYNSCSGASPLASFQTGDDTVKLPAGGVTRYFICGIPGHCHAGMKLAVTIEATANRCAPGARRRRGRHCSTTRRDRKWSPAALPPSSSAASPAGGVVSLAGLGLAALVALF